MWLLIGCWFGAALRYSGLFANTFHADEALFAGWSRLIAVWRDPLLLTQAVDKPPLLFYLQALFYPLFGPVEWAARMPSFIASLLMIPLTGQLTRRLTGDAAAAVIAALVIAVSPLAVQFSATAFSDSVLVFWLMSALYSVSRPVSNETPRLSGPFVGGLLFGLALATKYQALLFAPLLAGVAWFSGYQVRAWIRSLAGMGIVIAVLLLWQIARPAAGGLIALQWINIGGLRVAHSWELSPRLGEAARLWRWALGWTTLALAAVGMIGTLVSSRARGRVRPIDALLALHIFAYVLLHWLWAVPIWDRYLLPILPLVAILIGRVVSWVWSAVGHLQPINYAVAVLFVVLSLAHLPIASAARDGRFPIGGMPTADGGAAALAGLLKDVPYGTVLYDHWYSWHWRYQLFDSRVYLSWFPHADALLADLDAFADSGPARYIALPASPAAGPVIRHLLAGGYRIEPLRAQDETADMILYRIDLEGARD